MRLRRPLPAVQGDTLHIVGVGDNRIGKKNALDARLGEAARESLIFSVVFEDLHAFQGNRDAAVPCARLSQMLRFADEDLRTCTARAIRIYQDEAPEKMERPRSSCRGVSVRGEALSSAGLAPGTIAWDARSEPGAVGSSSSRG